MNFRVDSILAFITSIYFKDVYTVRLTEFIFNDSTINEYYRRNALKSLDQRKNSEDYILRIYNKSTGLLNAAARKILVSKYYNEKAILDQFGELDKFKEPFVRKEGVHSIGDIESEFFNRDLINTLINIPFKYEYKFIELLRESFNFYVENNDYYDYCLYIWKAIEEFYLNKISHVFGNIKVQLLANKNTIASTLDNYFINARSFRQLSLSRMMR